MEFQLLGPLEARQGDRPVDLGDRQQRYVLAALLLEANKPVSVDRLTDIVWGPAGHESATKLINGYISRLRRIFREAHEDTVQLDKDRYHTRTLRIDVSLIDYFRFADLRHQAHLAQRGGDDTRALTLLREAIGLWRGEFLEDLDNDSLRHPYQRQLERARMDTLHDWAVLELERENHESVQDQLYTIVSDNTDNERLAILLTRAMLESGDRNGALETANRTVRVLHDKGMAISPDLKELQERALRGESEHRPARLPRDLTIFAGREAELEILLATGQAADRQPPPPIVTISGMPGVGKTALAIHVAHRLATRFPDGQLFVDLCGFLPHVKPVAAGDALGRLLTMLGVSGAAIPKNVEDRAALYRDKMAGTRRIVLLDNAQDEAHVEPLLPGTAGSLVIVTSRRKLSGLEYIRSVHLDPLSPADALDLLTRLVGPERIDQQGEAAEHIVELAGRLPLAIRLIAGRLLAHPHWQVRYLAELLRKKALRLTEFDPAERRLAASFYVSYEQLSPEQRAVFCLLGAVPGPDFDSMAVAALTGTPEIDAEGLLEILHRLSLLEETSAGRYRLHDLLRAYAETLNDHDRDTRDNAVSRLIDYYLRTASAAAAVAFPHDRHRLPGGVGSTEAVFDGDHRALEWLRVEHRNLVAAVRMAAQTDRHPVAWQLACVIWRYLYIRGHLDDWRETLSLALQSARLSGQFWGQAQALQQLSVACWRAGDSQQAMELGRRSLQLWRELGDPHGEADARSALGLAAKRLGLFTEARLQYTRALARYQELDDQRGCANALDNLGHLDEQLGFLRSALERHDAALLILHHVGDLQGQLYVLNNIGSVQQKIGQLDEAAELHERALRISEQLEYPHGVAFSLNYLATVYRARGQPGIAIKYHRRALAIARDLGDPTLETDIHNDLGETYQANGDRIKALQAHLNALDFTSRTGDRRENARAHHGIARALHADNRHEEARSHWLQAVELYRNLDIPEAGRAAQELEDLDCACHLP